MDVCQQSVRAQASCQFIALTSIVAMGCPDEVPVAGILTVLLFLSLLKDGVAEVGRDTGF